MRSDFSAEARTEASERGMRERCNELVWQLLSRASLSGTAVEPVPYALAEAIVPPEEGAVELMALRELLGSRIVTAGRDTTSEAVDEDKNETSWSPDALDMSVVLMALQGVASGRITEQDINGEVRH